MTGALSLRPSIRWRAAVLTSSVVAVALAALTWYAVARVTRDLVATGIKRAQTAASVLAAQTALTTQQGLTRLEDVARSPELRAVLTADTQAAEQAATKVLDRTAAPGQTGVTAVWDTSGQLRLSKTFPANASALPVEERPTAPGLMPIQVVDGQAFSRTVVDIPGDPAAAPIGRLVVTRLIHNPDSSALLRGMVGNDATVLVGNQRADAPIAWTDLSTPVLPPGIDLAHTEGQEFRSPAGEQEIGAFAPIAGTPWVVLVEFPRQLIVEPAWQLLQRLLAAGVAFLILATLAARSLSRRVTQPLEDLTRAVQALEKGDYTRRVLVGQDEVGQLGQAFNSMARQIESAHSRLELRATELAASRQLADQANQAKDDFLAVLSHELRTPLSAMLGWCHLLKTGALDGEAHDRAIDVIERNARSQLRLVNDLLDVSRIVVGKFAVDLEPGDVLTVVRAAVDSNAPAAERRGVALESLVSVGAKKVSTIKIDSDRLHQALDNLLSNAIKFTPRGGTVRVSVSEHDGQIEIAVADNGEGIAPEILPTIFDRLRQGADGTKRRHAGLGLGLAIVRQIVELHHGTIAAESAGVGCGTTFRVRLPTLDPRHGQLYVPFAGSLPPRWEEAGRVRMQGMRVLLVEDMEDSREFLRQLLTQEGAVVETAPRAAAALEWLEQHDVDVIISDIEMPDQDGLSMMRFIRSSPTLRARVVPAIALSAYASLQDGERSLAAGFQVHLPKPVVVDDLLRTLTVLVAQGPKPSAN